MCTYIWYLWYIWNVICITWYINIYLRSTFARITPAALALSSSCFTPEICLMSGGNRFCGITVRGCSLQGCRSATDPEKSPLGCPGEGSALQQHRADRQSIMYWILGFSPGCVQLLEMSWVSSAFWQEDAHSFQKFRERLCPYKTDIKSKTMEQLDDFQVTTLSTFRWFLSHLPFYWDV